MVAGMQTSSHRPSRQPHPHSMPLLTRLQWKLYSESNLSLEDIAKIFKVSKQAIHVRLVKAGYKLRGTGNRNGRPPTPKWQKEYYKRLIKYGLSQTEAAHTIGISIPSRQRLDREYKLSGYSGKYNLTALNKIHYLLQNIILMEAWNSGATMKELAKLFNTSIGAIGVKMIRDRKKGLNLTRRRKK